METIDFKNIRDKISNISNILNKEKYNKGNKLNRRISVVLRSFYDIETIFTRLERNIFLFERNEREIQKENNINNTINELGQILRKKSEAINRENSLDLKCLYIFIKIFLDDFTELFRSLYDWRDIGDRSITKFYNKLKVYSGDDERVKKFKDKNLPMLKEIIDSIVNYRNVDIVHNQKKHKQCTWFMSDMRHNVKQVACSKTDEEIVESSSLNQGELINMLFDYINSCLFFIENNLDN
ncbi:MAG: hypothetical protein WC414_00635 [Patescibacteria group bacterium]